MILLTFPVSGLKRMRQSYSQFGEDLVIENLLLLHERLKRPGFYVDIGAHDPVDHSNTQKLHLEYGFTGINVDADAEMIEKFHATRPNDINVTAAISMSSGQNMSLHVLAERGMSTISNDTASGRSHIKTLDIRTVQTKSITELLHQNNAPSDIDLLNIDIEGMDLECLQGLDFNKYKPFCICIEDIDFDMHNPQASDIFQLLSKQGYILYSRTWITSLFFHPNLSRKGVID
jgi:FkbM family methyltransferase